MKARKAEDIAPALARSALESKALYDQLLRDALASLRHPLRQCNLNTDPRYRDPSRSDRTRQRSIRQLSVLQQWFIAERDRSPFSFERCCLMLSLDPSAVRDQLRTEGLLDAPEERIAASARQRRRDCDVRRAA